MGSWPYRGSGPHGKRHYRAGYRTESTRQERGADTVLRRRFPLRSLRRQPSENGLHERRLDGWRMEEMERIRVPDRVTPSHPCTPAPLFPRSGAGTSGREPFCREGAKLPTIACREENSLLV